MQALNGAGEELLRHRFPAGDRMTDSRKRGPRNLEPRIGTGSRGRALDHRQKRSIKSCTGVSRRSWHLSASIRHLAREQNAHARPHRSIPAAAGAREPRDPIAQFHFVSVISRSFSAV